MYVDSRGLKFSDKELRAFLIMKMGFLNFECYHVCGECDFEDGDSCSIKNMCDDYDVLFRGLVL